MKISQDIITTGLEQLIEHIFLQPENISSADGVKRFEIWNESSSIWI